MQQSGAESKALALSSNRFEAGWLTTAQYCKSPNCDARPPNVPISLLVIHNISLPPGEFGTGCVEQLFTNCLVPEQHPFFESINHLRVSCHFLIDRVGVVSQFVSVDQRAWHAGLSSFDGVENCNDFSVGIELEGTDEQSYSSQQYRQLTELTHVLMGEYPAITLQRITGHSNIAPGRKTDPGPSFDWRRYLLSLNA